MKPSTIPISCTSTVSRISLSFSKQAQKRVGNSLFLNLVSTDEEKASGFFDSKSLRKQICRTLLASNTPIASSGFFDSKSLRKQICRTLLASNTPLASCSFLDSKAQRKCLFSGFVFTGKERDEETGYGYFGARYLDHELMTMWLSVDPMADKYPSISPYAYCAWNPVRLVDPDGNDVWEVSDDGHIKKTSDEGGLKRQTLIYTNGQVAKYKGAKYHQVMSDLSIEGDNSISASYGNSNMQSVYATVFKSMADNTNVEWRMDRYTDGHYSLGTLHNQRKSPSSYELSNGRQNDKTTVTLIHSHPMASGYPNPETVESQKNSMGYWGSKGIRRSRNF